MLKRELKRPNIFKLSTKELSQDAFLTWLLQWANPDYSSVDKVLHNCGKDFLRLVLGEHGKKVELIKYLEAGRQWENIDVWAEMSFSDGKKILLIIEDKTYSQVHSGQLSRYKNHAISYCLENQSELVCTYFKIGSESQADLTFIREEGFNIVNRHQVIKCLKPYRDTEHSILRDYIEYIDELEDAHSAFENLPAIKWRGWAWVGFYEFIESRIDIVKWHWVNNLSGGFWNLCLIWKYWNCHIPVYMQIEEQRLCFKIALSEEETGLDNSGTDINAIQDYVYNSLESYAHQYGAHYIKRPVKVVHKGNYRTLAVVALADWCGDPDQLIDKEKILSNLKEIISFYKKFMEDLNLNSFQIAGIRILQKI